MLGKLTGKLGKLAIRRSFQTWTNQQRDMQRIFSSEMMPVCRSSFKKSNASYLVSLQPNPLSRKKPENHWRHVFCHDTWSWSQRQRVERTFAARWPWPAKRRRTRPSSLERGRRIQEFNAQDCVRSNLEPKPTQRHFWGHFPFSLRPTPSRLARHQPWKYQRTLNHNKFHKFQWSSQKESMKTRGAGVSWFWEMPRSVKSIRVLSEWQTHHVVNLSLHHRRTLNWRRIIHYYPSLIWYNGLDTPSRCIQAITRSIRFWVEDSWWLYIYIHMLCSHLLMLQV